MPKLKRWTGTEWKTVIQNKVFEGGLPGGKEGDFLWKDSPSTVKWIPFLHDHSDMNKEGKTLNPEAIEFETPTVLSNNTSGLFWDEEEQTIYTWTNNIKLPITDGLSTYTRNLDNTEHLKGNIVYVTKDLTGVGVSLASASNLGLEGSLAIAIQEVEDGKAGYYQFLGYLEVEISDVIDSTDNPLDWTEGKEVYLSTELGKLTVNKVDPQYLDVRIGWITGVDSGLIKLYVNLPTVGTSGFKTSFNNLQDGDVLVNDDSVWKNKTKEDAGIKGYHGFVDKAESVMSFNNATRTFSIQPTNESFTVYINGKKIEVGTELTLQIPDRRGQHFLSFEHDGTISVSDTPWDLLSKTSTLMATVYWDNGVGLLGEERHSHKRNLLEHRNQHDTLGTVYVKGFEDATFEDDNSFEISGGTVRDEDIYNVFNTETNCLIAYEDDNLMTFRDVGGFTKLNGTIPQYDNNGTLTNIASNKYTINWIFATNLGHIVSIIGQAEYTENQLDDAETPKLKGLSIAEWKLLYKVYVKNESGLKVGKVEPMFNILHGPIVKGEKVGEKNAVDVAMNPYDSNGILVDNPNVQSALEYIEEEKVNAYDFKTINGHTVLGSGNINPSVISNDHIIQKDTAPFTTREGLNFSENFKVEDGGGKTSVEIDWDNPPKVYTNGQPWQQQYNFNKTDPGNLIWTGAGNLPTVLSQHSTFITKNKLYILGGTTHASHTTSTDAVRVADIYPDGSLSSFTSLSNFPTPIKWTSVAIIGDRVYTFGGNNGGTVFDTIYYSQIGQDGTIGDWLIYGKLPRITNQTNAIVTKNRVYLIGGGEHKNGSRVTIYSAEINKDNTLGVWTNPIDYPISNTFFKVARVGNKVYGICGGESIGGTHAQIYVSSINQDGTLSSFTLYGTFPRNIQAYDMAVTKERVYTIAGYSEWNKDALATVYSAPIENNDSLGVFTQDNSLPSYKAYPSIAVTSDYIYLFGGSNTSYNYPTNTIYKASFTGGLNDYSDKTYSATWEIPEVPTELAVKFQSKPTASILKGQALNTQTVNDIPITRKATITTIHKSDHLLFATEDIKEDVKGYTRTQGTITDIPINNIKSTLDHKIDWEEGQELYLTHDHGKYTTDITNLAANKIRVGWITKIDNYKIDVFFSPSNVTNRYPAFTNDIPVGAIIQSGSLPPDDRYIRCNGALLEKNEYPELYDAIKDDYSYLCDPGFYYEKPWKQQYDFNDNDNGELTWTLDGSIPGPLGRSQAIVTKDRVYLLGGGNNSINTSVSTSYTAPIKPDGSLGIWTTGPFLPNPLAYSQAIVVQNKVYLLGGGRYDAGYDVVYENTINSDGTLNNWSISPKSLPGGLARSQAIVIRDRLYLLGGSTRDNAVSTVYSIDVLPDGELGTWKTEAPLPFSLSSRRLAVTKNRLYLIGGGTGYSTSSTAVHTAIINEDMTIGEWIAGPSLPSPASRGEILVTGKRMYYFGGGTSNNNLASVFTSEINPDGTIDQWSISSKSLPLAMSYPQVVAVKNKAYLLGGGNGESYAHANIYSTDFDGGMNDYTDKFYYKECTFDDQFFIPDLRKDDKKYPYSDGALTSYIKTRAII